MNLYLFYSILTGYLGCGRIVLWSGTFEPIQKILISKLTLPLPDHKNICGAGVTHNAKLRLRGGPGANPGLHTKFVSEVLMHTVRLRLRGGLGANPSTHTNFSQPDG